ncbi:hypothetical protein T484DRAFT_1823506 [Baffinella frigidus]|nr:hypothetical protein T484DRAFT_1823506 [Cryptophyta sp. CCMP2293]
MWVEGGSAVMAAFRKLFLFTLTPSGLYPQFAAWNVVFWTKVCVGQTCVVFSVEVSRCATAARPGLMTCVSFPVAVCDYALTAARLGLMVVHQLEEKLGYSNIGYYAALGVLAANTHYTVFLAGTSFLHYLRYMATYYVRENVAYGAFKRDVLLYKTVSIAQLVILYTSAATANFTSVSNLGIDGVAAAMIVLGYALSIYATMLLGVDGTYFGIELGFIKASKNYVQKFPFGVIPHPMILSQKFSYGVIPHPMILSQLRSNCVALAGFHRNEAFRAAWPYLIPAHICLYLCHMAQEHFDVHQNKPVVAAASKADKFKV